MTETERKAAFRACPILADYLSTALADLQISDADEGNERDSGTIYDCPDSVLQWAREYCERFMTECVDDVEAAFALEPGSEGLPYTHRPVSHERIGSTLYLASVGHGVTFTDDGNAPCLERMADWARDNNRESLYFGDDGKVYAI